MKKFLILIPLYNDWKSVSKLLKEIDFQTKNWESEVFIVIVNDGSTEKRSGLNFEYTKIKSIKIVNMKKNRGSARAIAAGLNYICEKEDFDRVVIMDADGEDRPEELNNFFEKAQNDTEKTITGNRYKRSEGPLFRFFYEIHKLLTFIFTGKLIKFGNFTCLPRKHAQMLIEKPYLWNSYSSSVVMAIKNRTYIPSIRGIRYVLPSKMNFITLVFHSLTIISVFIKTVLIRSFIFFLFFLFLIFKNFSIFAFIPILFLLMFTLVILKISRRSNIQELRNSLANIANIEVL